MATFGRLLESENRKTQKLRLKIFGSKSLPLSMPKKKVEKSIFLRARLSDHRYLSQTDWYAVKVSTEDHVTTPCRKRKRKGSSPSPSRSRSPPVKAIKPVAKNALIPWSSRCLALGSTVYSIGGIDGCDNEFEFHYSPNVRADSANHISTRWTEIAPMNDGRSRAEAVAVDGKIYVFGGLKSTNTRPPIPTIGFPKVIKVCLVGEVFDPSKNAWEPIGQPPVPYNPTGIPDGLFAVYDGDASKKIILSTPNVLLAYDVRCDSWEILDSDFLSTLSPVNMIMRDLSHPVLINDTLYWIWVSQYRHGGLIAYDLELKLWSEGSIKRLNSCFYDSYRNGTKRPISFHFYGDLFYLIWRGHTNTSTVEGYAQQNRSIVHCERIRVSKRVDNKKQKIRVKGYSLSTKSYILDSQVYGIDAVVK